MQPTLKIADAYFEKIKELSTSLDTLNDIEASLKTAEECGELARAVLVYNKAKGNTYREASKLDIVEEAIDTTMCALSVLYKLNVLVTQEEFEAIFQAKLEKWENKVKE
jgi:NTP pyrophosphatase (non-canonical NTP hydrolase)